MPKIGSHVRMAANEFYLGSVKEAQSYQAKALMIYTGAPQNTYRKPVGELKVEAAHKLMKEAGLDLKYTVVHAPYIINLGNPKPEKRAFAIEFLTKELKRTAEMAIPQMVLHPGNATGGDRKQAITWVGEGIKEIINNTKDLETKIAIETMAGKGTEVGITFEEIKQILDIVDNPKRVSVCFDTCHVHDGGYDLKNNLDRVLAEFDQKIGLDRITVIHLNDSKNLCGAAKDRHENIGFGEIGFEPLYKIAHHERFQDIPIILETPYVDGIPPYGAEIKMLETNQFNPKMKEELTK